MDKMRAGFIGAGRIADLHAVCDADREVAAVRTSGGRISGSSSSAMTSRL